MPFEPHNDQHVKLYACGPTVYDYAHVGNARAAVVMDVLFRLLQQQYPQVTYVANLTDVDDKIIQRALQEGCSCEEIASRYTAYYREDMAALYVQAPTLQPKATDYMPAMVAMIESLLAKGHAYVANDHVLFSVPSYPHYGALSNRRVDDQRSGSRVAVVDFKRHPMDFVLWKPSTVQQPGWSSPWGRGRPGWHIECSAMVESCLATPIDLHSGGVDLQFPHHDNEIAQSCCAKGDLNPSAFATYWLHNGFVTFKGEKMSKSLGNVVTIRQALNGYPGEVVRLALLMAHYRQPLDWQPALLQQAKKALDAWYRLLPCQASASVDEAVLQAAHDDLNFPKLWSRVFALAQAANQGDGQAKARLIGSLRFLGFLQTTPEAWFHSKSSLDHAWIEARIAEREAARRLRDFKTSDAIRAELHTMGVILEDSQSGVKWRTAD